MSSTLVIGGTGNVGQGVVAALLEAGDEVRVSTRDKAGATATAQAEAGADIVAGDLGDTSSLDAALSGVDRVVSITTLSEAQATQAANAVEATKRVAADAHLVRMSALVPEPALEIRAGKQVHDMDEALRASGLRYTILRPTFFMQNLIGMAGATVAAEGMIYLPMRDGEWGMIDVRDIVDSLVAVLRDGGPQGETIELTGPESVGMDRVAAAIGAAIGRDVKYVSVPREAGLESMLAMGMPKWVADAYGEMLENFASGGMDRTVDGVQRLTGHPPRSIDDFASDHAAMFLGD